MLKTFFFCLLLTCLLTNCGQIPHFEQNIDLPATGWAIKNELKFKFKIEDAKANYNVAYNIRNTLKYPYHNLYITYFLEDSKGKVIATELQNISLFDAKRGKPFGSGMGDTFSHQLPIPTFQRYKFPNTGNYTFRVVQYMRHDVVGIQTMGVRIEKE